MESCAIKQNAVNRYNTTQHKVGECVYAFVLCLMISLFIPLSAQAAVIYEINTEFSGATAPEATPPPADEPRSRWRVPEEGWAVVTMGQPPYNAGG